MAVLVVGGSGFIGGTVVQSLTKKGIETIGYDLIHASSADSQKNWIRADILEMQSIERIFFEYKIDSIVHLVGLPAIDYCQRNPHFSFLLNVMSVQNTLEAMRMADIPKIVFASSATVYGNSDTRTLKETNETHPTNVYGWHKLIAEDAIHAYSESYGIQSTILRLFNVYGGDPKIGKEVVSIFINRGLKGEPLIVKGPEKYRDFVHIEDVAEAFARSVTRNHNKSTTLNIGTGTRTTLKQLALMVGSNFPGSKMIVEDAADDGTGLVANVTAAKEVLGFSARNPKMGIPDHVRKYTEPSAGDEIRP
jgi:UDP-glucose 4-epimerase